MSSPSLTNCPVCGVIATLKCSSCKSVVYCGKEHQKIHWRKVHKLVCKCFQISTDPILGRYLRATKDIKCGEIILREQPIIYGPKLSTYPICLGCNKMLEIHNNGEAKKLGNFYKCTKCTWPLCNEECEKSNQHLDECLKMSEKNFICNINAIIPERKESAYCVILPLRCILMKQNNPQKFQQIMSLEDHLDERLETPLYKILKSNLVTFVRTILGLTELEEMEILKIAAILDTNAYEVRQISKKNKLRALYFNASMISHNCTPNTRHIFSNETMEILYIATTDIAKGGIICTSYTQPLKSTLMRREHLRMAKCFDCACKRCQDPTELGTFAGAILCSKCKIGKIISTNPLDDKANWQCQLCPHQLPSKQINWGNTSLQKEIENLDKKSPKVFEEFLIKYQDTLHDKNSHVLQIKYALTQLYGNVKGFLLHELNDAAIQRKIDLLMELLDIAEIFDPGWSLFRGMLLLDLQEIMVVQAKREFQNNLLTKEGTQEKLMESMTLLKEATEILKLQPDMQTILEEKILNLTQAIEMD